MPRLTITITDEQADLLTELSGDSGPYESQSEAVRDFIQRRDEHDRLQSKCNRLERRVSALIQQREEHSDLIEYVEDERELRRRREERREQRRQSNAFQRFAWWLFGEPADETD